MDPACPDMLETFVTVFWKGGGSWRAQLGKELGAVAKSDVDTAFEELGEVHPEADDGQEDSAGKGISAKRTPVSSKAGPYKCPCCSGDPIDDARDFAAHRPG